MRHAQCRQDCVLPRMSTDISSPEAKAESLEASGNMNRVWVESGLFLYRRGLITRCPFHTYTASVCGLASFPRKRESRGRAPWGLDARLRGHDILLAQDLRNGHLA